MKDIRKELRELGDAVMTSLGCIAIMIGAVILIIIVMYWTYWQPPEEDYERPSHSKAQGEPVWTASTR